MDDYIRKQQESIAMRDEQRRILEGTPHGHQQKGDRMFLAPMDESTGKGEEIVALCRDHNLSASIAHDLIMLHGYIGAAALLDRTEARARNLAATGDIGQAPPVSADTASSTHGHAGLTAATVPLAGSCGSFTRIALHSELDEHPEYASVPCYLNEGHEGEVNAEKHRGWHPQTGELSWDVVREAEGA